ncbi:MAG: radical SAM protein [Erysipelotrichaceae bacterium]|nr:radical SAM protein [Erysipelotrichaceae bacterium]MDD3924090.1 radical SAM protein [Erysipelotrichaceae bacterium]MDD4642266.1 radical SAM protein [Erysipelotrichaceae bacterium]
MRYIYGPVPSRRLGISLGISPIEKKTCNYACIYCQLGRTDHMSNTREMFYPVADIINEFKTFLMTNIEFNVITIVGEGEPTLYAGLKDLMINLKQITDKPLAIITNGALLYDKNVREELALADIVLPSLDAYDQRTFKKINRPHGSLDYTKVIQGLIDFSHEYHGQLWIEIMLVKDINDDDESLLAYQRLLKQIKYDRLYINTPVRPPAETDVEPISQDRMKKAVQMLKGIAIDLLVANGFASDIIDDQQAILSIIRRHPMNQYEIVNFLQKRGNDHPIVILDMLRSYPLVNVISYKGYNTYRLK